MQPFVFATLVLVSTLAAAAVGFALHRLPLVSNADERMRTATQSALGVASTLTAIVLGMVTASAASEFDKANQVVAGVAVDVLAVDNVLESYGPETQPVRAELKDALREWTDNLDSHEAYARTDAEEVAGLNGPGGRLEVIFAKVATLKPGNDFQKQLQTRALNLLGGQDFAEKRWLFTVQPASLPSLFLAVVLVWMVLEFLCFGLFAPRMGAVYLSIGIAAVVVSTAFFLILELHNPIDGFLRVSPDPLLRTLALIDQ